ncbi:MAG TPA: 3'(2'),5'-bisphosphate nucleotidase CysQ [Pyrinomonadaceae bacterium]|nr:3'(2'),5'-bisphosphate nucleotidase CysQ [Pyrinomonadaceae bacterium]
MFEKELETAIALARAAGKTILEHYALEIIAEEKLGIDNFSEPVTAADRAASRIIVDGLKAAFPADGVLSEEEIDLPETRLSSPRVWITDPIDGTAGFVKKDGDFAVQIGLAIDGEPVLGVVLVPVSDILYFATKSDGAYSVVSGGPPTRLMVSDKTTLHGMTVATSRNNRSPGISLISERLGFAGEVQRGSIGIKFGLIAEKMCDVYVNLSPRSKFWDTCGPQAILEEAGGKLTDLFGKRIEYGIADVQNHNGLVASSEAAHSLLIENIRPLLAELGRHRLKAKAV